MAEENENIVDPAAQGQGVGETAQQAIDKRFAEMAQLIHKKDETINNLIALQQQQMAQKLETPAPKPEDEYAHLIPKDASEEQRAVFMGMFGQFAKLVDNKIQTVQRQVAVTGVQNEVAAFAAARNLSPEVAAKTQEYLSLWRKDGREFNIEDAARFAIGDVALANPVDPRAAQQPQVFRHANPIPAPASSAQQPLPGNFDDLPLESQWSILLKRVGDKPL